MRVSQSREGVEQFSGSVVAASSSLPVLRGPVDEIVVLVESSTPSWGQVQ